MNTSRAIGIAATLLLFTGCALPGQTFDAGRYEPADDEAAAEQEYDLIRITPRVLRELANPVPPAPRANPALLEALREYRYRVGPQDVLTFTVWDHPELTIPAGEFRSAEIQGHLVNAEGKIFFPYIGEVHVGGRTLAEIREEVTRRLSRYIKEPQLDVRVASFRSKKVNVTGEVNTPGFFPVTDMPMTLVEALNAAGGGTPQAALQHVQVVRDGVARRFDVQALLERGDMSQNLLLQDGDIVYVPENSWFAVHMLGAVAEPGAVPMPRGRLNLAEAITRSGGFDRIEADTERVFVFRGDYDNPNVYWLDAKSPDAMLLATQFRMQPQDVVFVASTGLARWNRVISQILPTVQTLWQTQSFIERVEDD